MKQNHNDLVSIQVMRGLAALSVAFYHVYVIGRAPGYLGYEYWAGLAKPGLLGVNLFFVLSGFIIFKAHRGDLGQPDRLARYFNRRFTRIYPLYWVLSLVYVVAAFAGLGSPDFTTDLGNVFSSIFLIEFTEKVYAPLQVAWTLFYEIKFYIVFAVLIYNVRLGLIVIISEVVYMILASANGWADFFHLYSLWYLHFIFGALAYFLSMRLSQAWATPLMLVGIVSVGLYIDLYNYDMTTLKDNEHILWLLAPSFGAIVLAFVLWEQPIRDHCPRILKLLGDASYSVYLVHSAAISAMFIILRKVGILNTIHPTMVFIGCFVISVASGLGVYFLLEKPILSWVRSRSSSGSKTRHV